MPAGNSTAGFVLNNRKCLGHETALNQMANLYLSMLSITVNQEEEYWCCHSQSTVAESRGFAHFCRTLFLNKGRQNPSIYRQKLLQQKFTILLVLEKFTILLVLEVNCPILQNSKFPKFYLNYSGACTKVGAHCGIADEPKNAPTWIANEKLAKLYWRTLGDQWFYYCAFSFWAVLSEDSRLRLQAKR